MTTHPNKGRRGFHLGVLSVISTALILGATGSVWAQFHVQLSPQLVATEVKPGQRGMLEFELINPDDEVDLDVKVRSSSIMQGSTGEYLLADSTQPQSCEAWIHLQDSAYVLPAGRAIKIPVGLVVPTDATGGGYGAVVFEVIPPQDAAAEEGAMTARMQYRFQMPAWLELKIKRSYGSKEMLKVNEITMSNTSEHPQYKQRFGDMGLIVDAMVENTGNVHVFTTGRLILRDENNSLVADTRLGSGRGAVLPGATTRLRTITRMPRPGQYTVKAIVDYGGRSHATGQTTLEVDRKMLSQVGEASFSIPLEVEVKPEVIDLSAPVRAYRPFGATIINREKFPIDVKVRPGQLYHDIDGELWTTDNADSGRAVASWMEYEPKQFSIRPGRSQNIRVTLNVPEDAGGGYYGALQVTARPVDTVSEAGGFLPSELTLPIYLTVPPALDKAGEIAALDVDRSVRGGVTLKATFQNAGNVHVTARGAATIQRWVEKQTGSGEIIVMDEARFEDVGRVGIEPDTVLIFPGEKRMLSSETMEQLPPGRYRAKLEIYYGAKDPATVEKEFVVEPR